MQQLKQNDFSMSFIHSLTHTYQFSLCQTLIRCWYSGEWASRMALVVKNLLAKANAVDIRDVGLISRWGRSPGEGYGNPLQYSCLENSMDGGAWWTTVHGVAKSWTGLEQLSMHTKWWIGYAVSLYHLADNLVERSNQTSNHGLW